jgi:hypothetical protein
MEISKEEYEQLKANSQTLGIIGTYVEDFCKDEEDTVLQGVLRLLADYYSLRSDEIYHALDKLQTN